MIILGGSMGPYNRSLFTISPFIERYNLFVTFFGTYFIVYLSLFFVHRKIYNEFASFSNLTRSMKY